MVFGHATSGSSFSLPKAARQFFECRSASFLLAPALNVFPMEIIRDHVEIAGSVKSFCIDCNDRASDKNRTDYDRRRRIIAHPPKPTARSERAEGSGTAVAQIAILIEGPESPY